jgi:hypothetical protein
MPCSFALLAASSPANWAAKGVDFLDPLNPRQPALDHETTLPEGSVIVTTVLLNVDRMWATPTGMFFLNFFFAPLRLGFAMASLLPSLYRLRIMPRRGPFRVLAFVWVR